MPALAMLLLLQSVSVPSQGRAFLALGDFADHEDFNLVLASECAGSIEPSSQQRSLKIEFGDCLRPVPLAGPNRRFGDDDDIVATGLVILLMREGEPHITVDVSDGERSYASHRVPVWLTHDSEDSSVTIIHVHVDEIEIFSKQVPGQPVGSVSFGDLRCYGPPH